MGVGVEEGGTGQHTRGHIGGVALIVVGPVQHCYQQLCGPSIDAALHAIAQPDYSPVGPVGTNTLPCRHPPLPPLRLTTRTMRRMVLGSCLMAARSSWTGLPSAWGARAWCLQQVSQGAGGGRESHHGSCVQETAMQLFGTGGVAVRTPCGVAVAPTWQYIDDRR